MPKKKNNDKKETKKKGKHLKGKKKLEKKKREKRKKVIDPLQKKMNKRKLKANIEVEGWDPQYLNQ